MYGFDIHPPERSMAHNRRRRRVLTAGLVVTVLAAFAGTVGVSGPATAATAGPTTPGPEAISANAIVAAAIGEIGSSRPSGFNQPGECFPSVRRWIEAAGGRLGYGGPTSSFTSIGALEVSAATAAAGDIVQYTSMSAPDSWPSGVHTVLITGVNGDGSFQIVQSNSPDGSGRVTSVDRWIPRPPSGFAARFWRVGRPDVTATTAPFELFHYAGSGSGRTDAARVSPNGVVWSGVTGLGAVAPGAGQFGLGDMNRDGIPDLVAAVTTGDASGHTVVFAFAGPDYSRNIGAWVTPMGTFDATSGEVAVGDANGDGVADLIVLWGCGGSGHADLGILDGASGFGRFLYLGPTVIGCHDGRRSDIATGDFTGDGVLDIVVAFHNGTPTGKIDAFVLNGASGWQLAKAVTLPLGGFADGNGQVLSGRFGGTVDSIAVIYTAGTPTGRPDAFILQGLGTIAAAWTLPVGPAPTGQRAFVGR